MTPARLLLAVVLLPWAGLPANAAPPEPARSIGAVLDLPIAELSRDRRAVVQGTATFLRSHSLVLQDGEDAIFVAPRRSPGDGRDDRLLEEWQQIPLGGIVEVAGVIGPGGYAPTIIVDSLRVLSEGELPAAVRADAGRLYSGADDNRRVEIQGVVQGLDNTIGGDSWRLIVEAASRRIVVECAKELFAMHPSHFVDAEVRATGVVAAFRNIRGEFIAPRLCIARPDDLVVTSPPPGPPFETPLVPLEEIARFRVRPLGGHRLRTAGVVSFATPESLYLQEGMGGVRVDLAEQNSGFEPLRAGDRVEVAGFLDMSRRIGGIVGAMVRRIASGRPPEPLEIQPGQIVANHDAASRSGTISPTGSYDGRLVRCRGVVRAVAAMPEGVLVSLADGETNFNAELPPTAGWTIFAPRLAADSEVEITGIVRLDLTAEQAGGLTVSHPRLERLDLLVRDVNDVTLVHAAPWWTARRLGMALAALAAAIVALAAGSTLWVTVLRREVAKQTARAVAEATARREAALEYEVGLRERSRLAANLHDTILQTVTGIGFQLKACEVSRRREESGSVDATDTVGTGGHLAVAQKMLDHAAGQLRSTVWSLRSLPTDDRQFSVALREMADRHAAGHETRIEVVFDPAADQLPAFLAGNLLLVMQEALHNALHHGDPRSVFMEVALDADTVMARVRDDGAGFVVGSQAGPTQGHFGVAGMRERIERLGGTLTITSSPAAGTAVTAAVPLAAAQDHAHAQPEQPFAEHAYGRSLPVRTMSSATDHG